MKCPRTIAKLAADRGVLTRLLIYVYVKGYV